MGLAPMGRSISSSRRVRDAFRIRTYPCRRIIEDTSTRLASAAGQIDRDPFVIPRLSPSILFSGTHVDLATKELIDQIDLPLYGADQRALMGFGT